MAILLTVIELLVSTPMIYTIFAISFTTCSNLFHENTIGQCIYNSHVSTCVDEVCDYSATFSEMMSFDDAELCSSTTDMEMLADKYTTCDIVDKSTMTNIDTFYMDDNMAWLDDLDAIINCDGIPSDDNHMAYNEVLDNTNSDITMFCSDTTDCSDKFDNPLYESVIDELIEDISRQDGHALPTKDISLDDINPTISDICEYSANIDDFVNELLIKPFEESNSKIRVAEADQPTYILILAASNTSEQQCDSSLTTSVKDRTTDSVSSENVVTTGPYKALRTICDNPTDVRVSNSETMGSKTYGAAIVNSAKANRHIQIGTNKTKNKNISNKKSTISCVTTVHQYLVTALTMRNVKCVEYAMHDCYKTSKFVEESSAMKTLNKKGVLRAANCFMHWMHNIVRSNELQLRKPGLLCHKTENYKKIDMYFIRTMFTSRQSKAECIIRSCVNRLSYDAISESTSATDMLNYIYMKIVTVENKYERAYLLIYLLNWRVTHENRQNLNINRKFCIYLAYTQLLDDNDKKQRIKLFFDLFFPWYTKDKPEYVNLIIDTYEQLLITPEDDELATKFMCYFEVVVYNINKIKCYPFFESICNLLESESNRDIVGQLQQITKKKIEILDIVMGIKQ